MRIAIFIKKTTLHKGYGGLETQNKLLSEELVKRGYDVTVFSPKYELDINNKSSKGVEYVFIDSNYRTLFSSFIKNHWYKKSYESFLKLHDKFPFDIVISQSSAGIGIIKHKKDISVPIVSISHGSSLMEFKTLLENIYSISDFLKIIKNAPYILYNIIFKQKYFIKNSNKVVAVSSYVSKQLQKETNTDANKFVVINNSIENKNKLTEDDLNKLISQKYSQNFKRILYLGQIQRSKGVDELIKIAQSEDLENIIIDVVGGGEYLDEFKNNVEKLNLSNKFKFYGKVEYKKVIEHYKNAYLFLFPTKRYEGFPMVLVEAMFNYLPIISYNKGGVIDAIDSTDKNISGYLIDSNNTDLFIEKIKLLTLNEDLYKKVSIASYNKAVTEFEINIMIDKYIKLFENTFNENM